MNNFNNKIKGLGFLLAGSLLISSCSDVLDEQPRSIYDPSFFQTSTGIEGGLTSLYASLRELYGNPYYFNSLETGTDEYTYGQSADGNFKDADLSGVGKLDPSTCRSDNLWGSAFTYINSASGVIENAEAVGTDAALVSEACFFRAFYYFQLVQTFGGVPLDLGAGELKFNTTPSRKSVRNTVPEVYTKGVFPDLLTAIDKLPDNPRITGAVTKNVARLVLAKAYLTYGWWLQNPNDIPTYPECARTDPDGHDANWYFQQALDLAKTAIANPGPYKLQETYYDVTRGDNDRNAECMLYADHTENSEYYNDGSLTYSSWGHDNYVSWMGCWNYPNMVCVDAEGNKLNPVQRIAAQPYGRPWTRMAPPIDIFKNQFADKVNDSRYDGTFTTRFHANWNIGNKPELTTAINANGMTVKPGDVVFSILDEEPTDPKISYPVQSSPDAAAPGENGVGGGTLPGRADYVVGPEGISRLIYPMLYKQGPYRTDNNGTLGQPNAGSTRPFNILKFSEFYFIASEAAVKLGDNKTAYDMIKVIRQRAGMWKYDVNDCVEKVEDHSAEMVAATPSTITIDFLLDERMREYFGECMRWFDLARTQTWAKRAATYRICGSLPGDHTPKTFTRTITKEMYLRPIPKGQLDALEMTDEEKVQYQNPAYRTE